MQKESFHQLTTQLTSNTADGTFVLMLITVRMKMTVVRMMILIGLILESTFRVQLLGIVDVLLAD